MARTLVGSSCFSRRHAPEQSCSSRIGWLVAALGAALWALGSATPGLAQCFPIAGAPPKAIPAAPVVGPGPVDFIRQG